MTAPPRAAATAKNLINASLSSIFERCLNSNSLSLMDKHIHGIHQKTHAPSRPGEANISPNDLHCVTLSSPSHRATTAAAKQFPITFIAVRPMSISVSTPSSISTAAAGI